VRGEDPGLQLDGTSVGHRVAEDRVPHARNHAPFPCADSAREVILMRRDLAALMDQSRDSVMIIDLGQPEDKSRFQFLGVHEKLPTAGVVIV
jgi:hypothetical protein